MTKIYISSTYKDLVDHLLSISLSVKHLGLSCSKRSTGFGTDLADYTVLHPFNPFSNPLTARRQFA